MLDSRLRGNDGLFGLLGNPNFSQYPKWAKFLCDLSCRIPSLFFSITFSDDAAMPQELSISQESPSQPDCAGLSPCMTFMLAMNKLQAMEGASAFMDIKALLGISGFNHKGRNRIIHLSGEEINALCENSLDDEALWPRYVSEIQMLLSKMDQARKVDSHLGRPYITMQLASTLIVLAFFRFYDEHGCTALSETQIRPLMELYGVATPIAGFLDAQPAPTRTGEAIPTRSVIRLLELYRDELIKLARIKSGQNVIYYFALPRFDSVLDWFIATKPVLDKNRISRGWKHMENLSEKWHQFGLSDYYEKHIFEYPSWSCIVADRQEAWLAALPPDNPYTLVPLTTPQQLLEESQTMHHCVVAYLGRCISGNARIFSVLCNKQRIATAELSVCSGLWEVGQLKGNCNQELMHLTHVPDNPLAIALNVLTKWYNENASALEP